MKKNAYIVFGFLALVWGLTYLFNKTASHYVSPMHIVMVRVTMGFVPLLLIALLRRKLAWRHLRHTHHFVVMSLLAASVYYYAFAKGIAILPSSIAGILAGAIPFFTFIAALLFLILIPAMAGDGSQLLSDLGLMLIKGLGLVAVMLMIGKWVLPFVFQEISRARSEELFVLTVLLVALFSAWLTHSLHLSMALGAFLAGMMLGESHFRHQIEADIRPFRDILLGCSSSRRACCWTRRCCWPSGIGSSSAWPACWRPRHC